MEKIKTKSGFTCTIDTDIFDDYTFLEAVAMATDTENQAATLKGTTKLVDLIFGDNKKALMEHIASKNNGKTPVRAVSDELTDVMNKVKDLKNSSSSVG